MCVCVYDIYCNRIIYFPTNLLFLVFYVHIFISIYLVWRFYINFTFLMWHRLTLPCNSHYSCQLAGSLAGERWVWACPVGSWLLKLGRNANHLCKSHFVGIPDLVLFCLFLELFWKTIFVKYFIVTCWFTDLEPCCSVQVVPHVVPWPTPFLLFCFVLII